MKVKETVKVNEFGELISAEQTIIKNVNAEEFCLIYLRDNEEFSSLNGSEYRVLVQCWYFSVYYRDEKLDLPGNMFTYNSVIKKEIIRKTGLTEGTVNNALSSLTKKGMLLRPEHSKGIYYLNSKYFFKGRICDRTDLIKKNISYVFKKEE